MIERGDRVDSLAAAEREQRKIAEDLHDTLCQNLVGVSLLAQVLRRNQQAGKPLAERDLEKLSESIDRSLDEARLLFQDQDILLGGTDLHTALGKLAQITAQRIPCRYSGEAGIGSLTPQISHGLYRIAQEAVRNALKHSQAAGIVIQFEPTKDGVSLAITDDGCGFAASPTKARELHGIEMMERYASAIGGTLAVASAPGQGTVVTCLVPS